MSSQFPYKHIKIEFEFSTKSIKATLVSKYLETELLSELKHFFNWLASRKEVRSLYLTSEHEYFSEGINPIKLKEMEAEDLQVYSEKVYQLSLSMIYLPQTIVIDVKKGALNFAVEIISGADIRIAHRLSTFRLNHLKLGLIPSAGAMSILKSSLPHHLLQQWVSSMKQSAKNLESMGWLSRTYSDKTQEAIQKNVLKNIYQQASVERIQLKFFINQDRLSQITELRSKELQFFKACLITQDWKNPNSFMPAKHFSVAVKVAKENLSSIAS